MVKEGQADLVFTTETIIIIMIIVALDKPCQELL
jgi:hypothetical protein